VITASDEPLDVSVGFGAQPDVAKANRAAMVKFCVIRMTVTMGNGERETGN